MKNLKQTMKQKLAVFLAALLMMPSLPVAAEEAPKEAKIEVVAETTNASISGNTAEPKIIEELPLEKEELSQKLASTEPIKFNTGNHEWSVVDASVSSNVVSEVYFDEDGSYTIDIPEINPFFPYEVQFTYKGEVTNKWFMTPDDSVEVGGHTFYVSAEFDNSTVTQLSLNVAGDTVVVYPEKKVFTHDAEEVMGKKIPMVRSLLPLEEKRLNPVDLTAYTPAELTMVSVDEIFTGDKELADTDKVVWTRIGDDDYTISTSGDRLDLSQGTYAYSQTRWEMIVGDANQLAADNIRYIVPLNLTPSSKWLTATVYTQDSAGKRTEISVVDEQCSYYDNDYSGRYQSIYVLANEMKNESKAYISLDINPSVFANTQYDNIKVYEGQYATAEEAFSGKDITNLVCSSDMTHKNAGYELELYNNQWITIVTYDVDNNVTGCLPFYLSLGTTSNRIRVNSLFLKNENKTNKVASVFDVLYPETQSEGYDNITIELYKGYAANGRYYLSMDDDSSFSPVTAAYEGQYTSISEAVSAGAVDIKDSLFEGGYAADYSHGIYFTIFTGTDSSANQEVYRCCIKTVEASDEPDALGSGTDLDFYGLNDNNETKVACYIVGNKQDSYGEKNYITILVEANTDITSLAPVFGISEGAKLYAAGSNVPEVSGVSCHDFSNGPVQYTVSAENGVNSKNYWLQVKKATSGTGKLYINSLNDANANTRVENGIIYSTREVMLDSYHDNVHNIWLANIGTEAITDLSVELVSDVLVLDDYWTLNGGYALEGFSTIETTTAYGELPNFAKLRIRAKDSSTKGVEASGTLTIKSGDTTLMVLTLTGVIGDPAIITKDIPKAVKYVPYGTMVQNNNKYSWNKVSYQLLDGTLPDGMVVKKNGEIYGVPKETGEFTFTVKMISNSGGFEADTKTYTLVVDENTDVNVDGATDYGYDLSQRVQDVFISNSDGSQTLVSQGVYAEFVDIYLDGEKLIRGKDYTSESGSTRITIQTQTLANRPVGTHTLGIEFRTKDTDKLKRAAQNYNVCEGGNSDNNDSNENGSPNNGGNSNGNVNGGTSDGENSNSSVGSGDTRNWKNQRSSIVHTAVSEVVDAITTVTYTIESGDTLWKIAEKYYGSGQYWERIYEDNKETITDPDKIYVGQVIVIHLEQETIANTVNGTTYTVQAGDSLFKISEKYYGKGWQWRKIYQANEEIISAPEKIYIGQVIVIPE